MNNKREVQVKLMELEEELQRCQQAVQRDNESLTSSILSNMAVLINDMRNRVR